MISLERRRAGRYSLPMARQVKNSGRAAVARARISSKHQITIGKAPFEEAGLKSGELVSLRATGPGRIELTNLDALFEKHRGAISTGGAFRRAVEQSRDEWD